MVHTSLFVVTRTRAFMHVCRLASLCLQPTVRTISWPKNDGKLSRGLARNRRQKVFQCLRFVLIFFFGFCAHYTSGHGTFRLCQDIPIREEYRKLLGTTEIICGSDIDEEGRWNKAADVDMHADRQFVKQRLELLMNPPSPPPEESEDKVDSRSYVPYFLQSVDVYAPCSILEGLVLTDAPGERSADRADTVTLRRDYNLVWLCSQVRVTRMYATKKQPAKPLLQPIQLS
mgnify:CR=1 FL=1